jgi:hypothetical protein
MLSKIMLEIKQLVQEQLMPLLIKHRLNVQVQVEAMLGQIILELLLENVLMEKVVVKEMYHGL